MPVKTTIGVWSAPCLPDGTGGMAKKPAKESSYGSGLLMMAGHIKLAL
jgi:hypothetical protein